jgi:hypothetical protein
VYVPLAGSDPRCRRCWGNYESQSWSYKPSGPLAFLGPIAYVITDERRRERHEAAQARYAIRRALLTGAPRDHELL